MSPPFFEQPVRFGRDESLIGILCSPDDDPDPDRPVVLFINAGIVHRMGPNRLYVRIARALAEEGFASLRFDLSGVGDSMRPAEAEPVSLVEGVVLDIQDALKHCRENHDARRFVLVGLCSGADNALRTMGRDPRVVGSVLLDLNAPRTRGFYLRRYARGVFRLEFWIQVLTGRHPLYRRFRQRLRFGATGRNEDGDAGSEPSEPMFDSSLPVDVMREQLERIISRRGQLLCVFTPGLDAYNYRKQFLQVFPDLDFDDCLRLEYFADSDHTFSSRFLQDRLIGTIVEWMTETSFPAALQDHSVITSRETKG